MRGTDREWTRGGTDGEDRKERDGQRGKEDRDKGKGREGGIEWREGEEEGDRVSSWKKITKKDKFINLREIGNEEFRNEGL